MYLSDGRRSNPPTERQSKHCEAVCINPPSDALEENTKSPSDKVIAKHCASCRLREV